MCSTVILGAGANRVLAFNFDYALGHGLVATNLRRTCKENGREPGEPVLSWEVRHGSVTFNSVCLELPTAGMNERGLCLALMWHDEGDFGSGGPLRLLDPLQWMQYQLDQFSSIEDVVNGLSIARPKSQGVPLHYMVLDANGDHLLLEFLEGEPRVTVNPPVPVLTNSTYAKCISVAGDVDEEELFTRTSLGRFATLLRHHSMRGDDSSVPNAFDTLYAVQQSTPPAGHGFPWASTGQTTSTVWSVVFAPARRAIHFYTHRNPQIRTVELRRLDFDPASDYRCANIHDGEEGDITDALHTYRIEDNRRIVEASASFLSMTPEARYQLVRLVDATYRSRRLEIS